MQTVLITGANRGIGLALVQAYLARQWHVIAVCRTPSASLLDSQAEVISGIDVTQAECIAQLVQQLQGRSLDLLINNAGILQVDQLPNLQLQALQDQFAVNALAPLWLTVALLNHLKPQAKLAFITSRMGSMGDNQSGGFYGYRMSKAALNAAAVSLARDLSGRGIAVGILHPGYVQTAMVNYGGDISAETAAERLVKRIDELNLANSGGFWHSNGERLPW